MNNDHMTYWIFIHNIRFYELYHSQTVLPSKMGYAGSHAPLANREL